MSDDGGRHDAASVIGVLGAGTMGAGIAQLACVSGASTLLHDPIPEALERGLAGIHAQLERGVQRGRLDAEQAAAARERLSAVADIGALSGCELVIEAAPESLELKHGIYRSLAEVVAPDCVLATNTSSLPVTAIASVVPSPERVIGMHFFNPAPVMKLLEIVAGDASDERSLSLGRATGVAMGKVVIDAADGPGFLVNRCNRPFGLEALRLLEEGVAGIPEIDRIVRAAGFRMGPFELMDLVGVDVGMEVSKSFYALSFGEPRWRPSTTTQRMVDAGRHGRKTGRGYYEYEPGPHRPEDPPPPDPTPPASGAVIIAGERPLARELRALADAAGWQVGSESDPLEGEPELVIDCGLADEPPPHGAPLLLLCDAAPLSVLEPGGSAVGFHALPPFEAAGIVELTRLPSSSQHAAEASERFFASLGKHVIWVGDAPGLVLGRIVCQVINEAAFALGAGVGSAADIDLGMVHGLNHPRGPLAWADEIGLEHVLTVLEGLSDEYREERYRPAPVLRRLVREGRLGRQAGAGFHEY